MSQRDVSLALQLAKRIQRVDGKKTLDSVAAEVDELVRILTTLDARTGKRDPSKRKKS